MKYLLPCFRFVFLLYVDGFAAVHDIYPEISPYPSAVLPETRTMSHKAIPPVLFNPCVIHVHHLVDHHSAQFLLCPVHYLSEPYLIVRAALAVILVLIFAEASQGGLREVEEAALTQFTSEVHLITLIEKSLQLFLRRVLQLHNS